jgi:hypothetical protein
VITRAGALVAALSVAVLANCGESLAGTGPRLVPTPTDIVVRDTSPIQTDATSYQLVRGAGEWRAWVTATYRNDGRGPVFYPRCGGGSTGPMFGVVRAGPDSTATFFTNFAFACVGGVPTGTILPRQSVTVRVPLGSVDQPNMQPPLRPEHLVGSARVVLRLCSNYAEDSDYCTPLPRSMSQSNVFLIHY